MAEFKANVVNEEKTMGRMRSFSSRFIGFLLLAILFSTLPLIVQHFHEHGQSAAKGNIYYVSPSGSDSNNGSQAYPFATIQKAASVATSGTTIHVAPGTYTEGVITVPHSGTATAPITFVSDVKWGAKIADTSWHAWDITGSYIIVKDFEMYMVDPAIASDIIDIQINANYVQVIGNYVHDVDNGSGAPCYGGAAINYYDGTGARIIGNRIAHAGPGTSCNLMHGIYVGNTNAYIANNIISDISGYGIQIWPGGDNSAVVNNDVSYARTGGIIVGADTGYSADYVLVANNIVRGGIWGIREYVSDGGQVGPHNTYTNNDVFGSTIPYYFVSGATPQNSFGVDPQYVWWVSDGSGDYHLQATSPMIGKGTSIGAPTTDFDGNPRPQGNGYDIGAYQYQRP
jgi:hypothetical protein